MSQGPIPFSSNFPQKTALGITAAAVIKSTGGRLFGIIVVAPGSTSGAFTLNDCTTTTAAAASNEVYSLPYNASNNVAGTVITFTNPIPFANGIVVSAVPGAGSPQLTLLYN